MSITSTNANSSDEVIAGHVAGVPFTATPPAGGIRPLAPTVLAWHLADPPRTHSAFAAAVPLAGLDAWRVYLGLPLSGTRLPAGGEEEVMRLAYDDVVLNLQGPTALGAADELERVLAGLREQHGIATGALGVMGGSIGAVVAQLAVAEAGEAIDAAVLINPVVQLRSAVAAGGRQFGITYDWTEASDAVADRLDFLARGEELAAADPAVLLIVGADDEPEFREPAAELRATLAQRYGGDERAKLVEIADMAHALAEEPGTEPAPQTLHAAEVDRHAVEWFQRHLAH